MKQFSCGDVVPGCDAQFVGASNDEILGQVSTHAASVHGIDDVPQSLIDQVVGNIQVVG